METETHGPSFPRIILGTWAIGGWMWGGADEKQSIEAIRMSIECGIRAIDTAPAYGNGLSEQIVGKAIQGYDRDHLLIATKCGLIWNHKEIHKNLKAQSILNECNQSLKRLKIDHIDLYQIHWNDPHTPIEESWGAMVKLLEVGKVKAIGVCNFSAAELAIAHSLFPIHTLQSPYSLMRRSIETDILPFCQNNQIALLAYSPLERGLLTGKISLKTHFPSTDHREQSATFSLHNRKRVLEALNRLKPIAEKHQATLAQLILHCTYHMPGITSVLVGARNAAQAAENAAAHSLRLTQAERFAIVDVFTSKEMQLIN